MTTTIVRPDDVIAAALNTGGDTAASCPIGIVTAVDEHGLRLDLFSFVTGEFTAGPRIILWSEIVTIRHATAGRDGWNLGPLALLQTKWQLRDGAAPALPTDEDADGAWHSIWLHGKWRWLTSQMTTPQREHAAAAVERHWAAMDDGEDVSREARVDLWWWRD